MQKFKIIGKPLLGEKYVEGKKEEERIMPNLVNTTSALAHTHNVFAHAICSHQNVHTLEISKSFPINTVYIGHICI